LTLLFKKAREQNAKRRQLIESAKPKKKRFTNFWLGIKKIHRNRKRYLKFSLNKSINKSHSK
jgi:hypothetical protein